MRGHAVRRIFFFFQTRCSYQPKGFLGVRVSESITRHGEYKSEHGPLSNAPLLPCVLLYREQSASLYEFQCLLLRTGVT